MIIFVTIPHEEKILKTQLSTNSLLSKLIAAVM